MLTGTITILVITVIVVIATSSTSPVEEEKDDTETDLANKSLTLTRQNSTQNVTVEMVNLVPVGIQFDIVQTVNITPHSVHGVQEVGMCSNFWNSCTGRCGKPAETNGLYTCHCDDLCMTNGDCCLDYFTECNLKPIVLSDEGPQRNEQLPCIAVGEGLYEFGVRMIDTCPLSYTDWKAKMSCEDIDYASTIPVTAFNGKVYRNVHCAVCNGVRESLTWTERRICIETSTLNHTLIKANVTCNTEFIPPENVTPPRRCWYDVGKCADVADLKVTRMCTSYSGTVWVSSFGEWGSPVAYRNYHCALCNGESPVGLRCTEWIVGHMRSKDFKERNELRYLPIPKVRAKRLAKFINQIGHLLDSMSETDIPAAFSILFNFNLDGHNNVMFTSEEKDWWKMTQTHCRGDQVWDPFLNMCRQIACGNSYTTVNHQCVEDPHGVTTTSSGIIKPGDDSSALADAVTSMVLGMDDSAVQVVLALDVTVNGNQSEQSVEVAFTDDFFNGLANSLSISFDRFTNITFPCFNSSSNGSATVDGNTTEQNVTSCEHPFATSFVLTEPKFPNSSEPSIQMIMSVFTSSISMNTMVIYVGNDNSIVSRVIGIKEGAIINNDTVAYDWCSKGIKREYTDEAMSIYFENDDESLAMGIVINSTGKKYEMGEFIMNRLYQGHTQDRSTMNSSGVVIVCDELPPINESCMYRVVLYEWEYTILDNNSIYYFGNLSIGPILDVGEYEFTVGGNVEVCYDFSFLNPDPFAFDWSSNIGLRLVGMILLCISGMGVTITFITYCLFRELRNLPGSNIMNLAVSILFYQITFLAGMRGSVDGTTCLYVAISLHYSILASFFWMNVMAIDMFLTFGTNHVIAGPRSKRKYLPRYGTYAYGVPAVVVGVCAFLHFCNCVSDDYTGYAEHDICWITNPFTLGFAFAMPIGLVLVFNSFLFVITIKTMRRITKEARMSDNVPHEKNDIKLYARMSTVMGFTWVFGFLIAFQKVSQPLNQLFQYLFVMTNTLQGFFIFLAFTCNPRVIGMYSTKFAAVGWGTDKAHVRTKNADPNILRTLSLDTFNSALSEACSKETTPQDETIKSSVTDSQLTEDNTSGFVSHIYT